MMVADTLLCLGNSFKALSRTNKAISCFKDSIEIRKNIMAKVRKGMTDDSFIIPLLDLPDDLSQLCNDLIECYDEMLPLLKRQESGIPDEINCLEEMGDVFSLMRNFDDAFVRYVTLDTVRKKTKFCLSS